MPKYVAIYGDRAGTGNTIDEAIEELKDNTYDDFDPESDIELYQLGQKAKSLSATYVVEWEKN